MLGRWNAYDGMRQFSQILGQDACARLAGEPCQRRRHRVVFLRRDGDVYRVDADGKNLKRLTRWEAVILTLRVAGLRRSHVLHNSAPLAGPAAA